MSSILLCRQNHTIVLPAGATIKLLLLTAFFGIASNLYAGAIPAHKKNKAQATKTAAAKKPRVAKPGDAALLQVSYSNPHTYVTNTAISPLAPAASGVAAPAYSSNPVGITGTFARPRAVATDRSGNVYFLDLHFGVVYKMPAGGGSLTTVASGFNAPTGLALDAAGNIYVADYGNSAIKEIPVGTTTAITLTTSVAQPYSISSDADGDLYIADFGNKAILKLPSGSSMPFVFASGFNGPLAVTVDRNYNVYIGDTNNASIIEYPYGSVTPVNLGSGFNSPYAIAVDNGGNVFVGDVLNASVKEIIAGSSTVQPIMTGLSYPEGVAVDNAGNVFVGDYGFGEAWEIPPIGGFHVGPALPRGITFDTNTGIFAGTPLDAAPAENYTVTAYNGTSATSGIATFTVNLAPPTSMTYASPQTYVAGTAIAPLSPTGGSGVTPSAYGIPITASTAVSQPYSVSADAAGNLYVIDIGLNAVLKIPPNNGTPQNLGSGFNLPTDAILDAAGNIYVADYGNHAVKEIVAGTSGAPVTLGSGFVAPRGLAIDKTGNIYIADEGGQTVKEILAGSGTTITLATGLIQPVSVAVDVSGNVYVIDRAAATLSRIPVTGGAPVLVQSGYSNPYAVVIDPLGNIFVADRDANVIQELPATGGLLDVATGLNAPDGLGLDSYGNLFIADQGDNNIKELKPTGGFYISSFLPQGLSFDARLGTISGIPLQASPATAYTVSGYNAGGGVSTTLNITVNNPPAANIRYNTPQTYAVGTTITPLTPTATGIAAPGFSNIPVVTASGFSSPTGVAVDAAGNVYIADAVSNEVKELPAGGGSQVVVGSGFNVPFGVAVDAAGNVYVADQGNNAIKKIPVGGGSPVTLGSGFNAPTGVAVDAAGNVYVADYRNSLVKKIPAGTNTPVTIGTGFNMPVGIAVDGAGNVFVGDNDNNAVKEITAVNGLTVTLASSFSHPYGVTVDGAGNVYVADNFNSAIKMITPAGAISTLGGGFANPEAVAIDKYGHLFVADYGNKELKEVNPIGGYFVSPFLPAGLSINNATGAISGTPAKASPATNYTVTGYNNYSNSTQPVNITVTNNAWLSSLTPGNGTLSPAFTPTNFNYTLAVSGSTTSITFLPVSFDTDALIKVNGTTVQAGVTSQPINLNQGANTVTIVVTAQGGAPVNTYAVIVTRTVSNIATLSSIGSGITPLTPIFNSNTTSYTLSVNNATTSLTVKPVTTDAGATIKVNGTTLASGTTSAAIALAEGTATAINVVVTAQNGTTTKTYTITVTRAPSTVATLSAMGSSITPLTPVFNPTTTSYTLSVPNATATMTVKPVTTDAHATIKVNGTASPSGTTFGPIALAPGTATAISVVVTAQNGATTKTYTITVTRAPSGDATLSALGPQFGPLTPVFNSATTSYTLSVSNATKSMTVKPATTDAHATIKVNGTAISSGTTSAPIALATGSNTIATIVTAQDGTTKNTYTITVTRASGSADSFDTGISVTIPMAIGTTETPTLVDDGIIIHQAVSPNGDGISDFLQIDNISQYPDNKLTIMNRNGQLIYEAKAYDNSSKIFDGHSSKNGQMQLPGTYFYQLDYTVNGIAKHKTGFLVLKY